MFIDLSNPGANSKDRYYYLTSAGALSEIGRQNLDHFLSAPHEELTGPPAPRDEIQTSGPMYDKCSQQISKNAVLLHLGQIRLLSVGIQVCMPWRAVSGGDG